MSISQETAYQSSDPGRRDLVRFWREGRLDDLECLKARYIKHRYLPHTHDTYALGVMLQGAEVFHYRGARHIAGRGKAIAVNPDELHDGAPYDDGFAYRMLYPSVELVQSVAEDLYGRPVPAPRFPDAPVLDDAEAAGLLVTLHRMMERQAPNLAVDTVLSDALSLLIRRYGAFDRPLGRLGRESAPIRRARDFIDAHSDSDVTLAELAAIAGFSRYHFLRAFRREVGITPHAYLLGRRIARAKELLAGEQPLSAVAMTCGFFDQSHLSRTFKAWVGVTPGQYRQGSNILQD